jgi:hypothetical protein
VKNVIQKLLRHAHYPAQEWEDAMKRPSIWSAIDIAAACGVPHAPGALDQPYMPRDGSL